MRAMAWCFFAALFLCASSVATACPLCLGAFRSSVAQRLVDLPQEVLAQPSADGRGYRVVAVIKGEQPAGGIIPTEAIQLDFVADAECHVAARSRRSVVGVGRPWRCRR